MSRKPPLLVLPSYEYHSTYAGTKYLLNRLAALGVLFHVLLRIDPKNRERYGALPYQINFFAWWSPAWPKWKRVISLIAYRLIVIRELVSAKTVLLCDSLYFPEVAFVKKFRKSLRIIHFCQELQLVEDYPSSAVAKFAKRHEQLSDWVIDVDPYRAKVRQEYYNLKSRPMALYNTVPSSMKALYVKGTLWRVLGMARVDRPVVLYAGGCGVEKPFSRLIDAVAGMETEVFFVAFLSAPESLYTDAQVEAARKLEPGTFVIHAGVSHKTILSLLSDADVGIVDYPFSAEPSQNSRYCAPTKFYEYMAAGLALVTSSNITLTSIVEPNQVGKSAVDDSIAALTDALDDVCSDSGRLQAMRRRSAELFDSHYSYERVNYKTIDALIAHCPEFTFSPAVSSRVGKPGTAFNSENTTWGGGGNREIVRWSRCVERWDGLNAA